MTKLLFLAGFFLSSIAGLFFLIFFLFAMIYVQESGAFRAALIHAFLVLEPGAFGTALLYGFGFLISVIVAVGCYVIPEKMGLIE